MTYSDMIRYVLMICVVAGFCLWRFVFYVPSEPAVPVSIYTKSDLCFLAVDPLSSEVLLSGDLASGEDGFVYFTLGRAVSARFEAGFSSLSRLTRDVSAAAQSLECRAVVELTPPQVEMYRLPENVGPSDPDILAYEGVR